MPVDPVEPAEALELGGLGEPGNPAETEIGHGDDGVGKPEDGAEVGRVDDAHPADANPFGPTGQPEVLHGADGAIKVHLGLGRPAEDYRAVPRAVAGHAEVE